jgi:hypothetical protein
MTTETTIKERPIRLYPHEVRGILDGRQTQLRRIMKPQPAPWVTDMYAEETLDFSSKTDRWILNGKTEKNSDWATGFIRCPYSQPGTRLWVRETWGPIHKDVYIYRADYHDGRHPLKWDWRPSIHMPRAASRILLEITDVRCERLQDIRRGDSMAEGCPFPNMAKGPDPRLWFSELWQSINGPESWDANPWVFVIEFRKLP